MIRINRGRPSTRAEVNRLLNWDQAVVNDGQRAWIITDGLGRYLVFYQEANLYRRLPLVETSLHNTSASFHYFEPGKIIKGFVRASYRRMHGILDGL